MSTSDRISRYLRDSGWPKAELAARAGVSPSTITRLLHGRSGSGPYELGELVALKLERATVAAFTAGETHATPLRAIDLLARDEAA